MRDRLGAFDLVNANLTIDFSSFALEFWATNLFDEKYSSGQGGDTEYYGAPGECGVSTRVEF